MAPVDVTAEIEIARPRVEVAAYAIDPENAAEWSASVTAVRWLTPPPLTVGSRLAFTSTLLGSPLAYAYEVRELRPEVTFVMVTDEGPFPMETTYGWRDAAGGGTVMTLRRRGEPVGFSKVSAPLVALAVARTGRKDLRHLKRILEARPGA